MTKLFIETYVFFCRCETIAGVINRQVKSGALGTLIYPYLITPKSASTVHLSGDGTGVVDMHVRMYARSRRTPGGSARNTTDFNVADIDAGSSDVVLLLPARFVSCTRGICM